MSLLEKGRANGLDVEVAKVTKLKIVPVWKAFS